MWVHVCFAILSVAIVWTGLFHHLLIPRQNHTVLVSWLFFFTFLSLIDPLYTLPAPYDIADGFISFMDSFLYLGTLITPDLHDETDVRSRIKKATAQVGTLRPFFRHPTSTSKQNNSIYCYGTQHSSLGLQSMDHHRLHQTHPPSIPSPQSKNHTEHQHVQSQKIKNHQCPDPEMCQCTWYSHLPHEKIPLLDWQTSKNANEQTAMPIPCHLGQKPTKKRKTTVHPT
jgi:hypothetical protein